MLNTGKEVKTMDAFKTAILWGLLIGGGLAIMMVLLAYGLK